MRVFLIPMFAIRNFTLSRPTCLRSMEKAHYGLPPNWNYVAFFGPEAGRP